MRTHFPLQNCRQFIKVARKERRVILTRSPRIHKKLHLKTSQEPPSTPSQNPPPSNIPHTTSSREIRLHWLETDPWQEQDWLHCSSSVCSLHHSSFLSLVLLLCLPPAWFSSLSFAGSGSWAFPRSRWPRRRTGSGSCQSWCCRVERAVRGWWRARSSPVDNRYCRSIETTAAWSCSPR